MTDPKSKNLLPGMLSQNPSPWEGDSQDRKRKRTEQVERVLTVFKQLVPSTYSSQVQGPFYMTQFQAVAERLADFQISAQEIFADSMYDFTRPEVLYQILGDLVFPEARTQGYPEVQGDISYRTFLRSMVSLLLRGSTAAVQKEGIELLTEATVEIIEKGLEARKLLQLDEYGNLKTTSAWGPEDAFTFEINISKVVGEVEVNGVMVPLYGFPLEPLTLQRNVYLVLRALKPAHALYDYRHLFQDAFGDLFTERTSWELDSYYYQDFRRYWLGAARIAGVSGVTRSDRSLFSDPTRDFTPVRPGSWLTILSGPNSIHAGGLEGTIASSDMSHVGRYRVTEVLAFEQDDSVVRAYLTSPTGLTGYASVLGDVVTDTSQVLWHTVQEGEVLTFLNGPNAGDYRINFLLGPDGGPAGVSGLGPDVTGAQVSPGILRVQRRMGQTVASQQYEVQLDRLGDAIPHPVVQEDVSVQFSGWSGGTRDWLLTSRGPLTKTWGSMTPATKQDVVVWVNGVSVDILEVDPYLGKVTLVNPIALLPLGDPLGNVLVDYNWFPNPIFPMGNLNTEGSVLNQWDQVGDEADVVWHGEQIQDSTHPKGAVSTSRFPMSLVLGPVDYPEPMWISHRYQGYEKAYSALLNSPTTLLLNQNPYVSQVPAFEVPTNGKTRSFEGTQSPLLEDWFLTGTDEGQANGDGTYTVVDGTVGPYNPMSPPLAMYWEPLDLTFPSSIFMVGRLRISSIQKHGVFTGVGMGLHDNSHLYLAGALLVDDPAGLQAPMMHLGLLQDPTQMSLLESWHVGPLAAASLESTSSLTAASSSVPLGFVAGSRFQIVSGTQAGFYTAVDVVRHSTGVTEVTVSPAFPEDPQLWGNKYFDILFEVDWVSSQSTLRLVVNPGTRVATLFVSGQISGVIADLDGSHPMPEPAQTSLLLSTEFGGQLFWGALDSYATSASSWSFLRYGVIPDQTILRGYAQVVNTEMTVLPEDETPGWFSPEFFGHSKLNPPSSLLLKSTSASTSQQQTFGYKRIEPFLGQESHVDLRASFQVDTGVLGAGDATLEIQDGQRVARLATLLYFEGGTPWRQLVSMPLTSYAGYMAPDPLVWEFLDPVGSTSTWWSDGPDLNLTVPAGQAARFLGTVDTSSMPCGDSGWRMAEAQMSSTSEGYFLTLSSDSGHTMHLYLRGGVTPGVSLVDDSLVIVQDYNFDWTDGGLHTYRLVLSNGVVSVLCDDVLQAPAVGDASFASGGSNTVIFGSMALAPTATTWRSVSYSVLPPANVKRTLGIWLGGDSDDIDQWQIPRSDATTEPNSYQVGPVVEEMDWRNTIEVDLLKTVGWGVTLIRPDLPPPPYYNPETPGFPETGFATPIAVPSAGWINVEDALLPRWTSSFGSIAFGALDSRSVTQQKWEYVRYKVFKTDTEEHASPEHMVLNQYNVISSGELLLDTSLETVTVPVVNTSSLDLNAGHVSARTIYRVNDGVRDFYSSSWSFNLETQVLSLTGGLTFAGSYVTVVFSPGLPVTSTYLMSQPVEDGMTILNERTPPIPMGQCGEDLWVESSGSLNPPYLVSSFEKDPEALYEQMSFMTVDNGGQSGIIFSIQEGVVPDVSGFDSTLGEDIYAHDGIGAPLLGTGNSANLLASGSKVGVGFGAHVLGFSGTSYTESARGLSDGVPSQGGGLPGKILFASGGSFYGLAVDNMGHITTQRFPLGGLLNEVVLYPCAALSRGCPRRTDWVLRVWSLSVGGLDTPLVETMPALTETLTEFSMLVPPS